MIEKERLLNFQFAGRTITLSTGLTGAGLPIVEAAGTIPPAVVPADSRTFTYSKDKPWYTYLDGFKRITKRDKLSYQPLTKQYYYGNPALMGKNWTKNPRDIVELPLNNLLLNFEPLTGFGSNYLAANPDEGWWDNSNQGMFGRWLGNDKVFVNPLIERLCKYAYEKPELKNQMLAALAESRATISFKNIAGSLFNGGNLAAVYDHSSEYLGLSYDNLKFYDWKTLGAYRGARGTTIFKRTGADQPGTPIKYMTTRVVNDDMTDNFMFYDNDTAFWATEGNNECFILEHRHYFRKTNYWHDDFSNGHWVRGCFVPGENNTVILNFHEDFIIEGDLARDTWGRLLTVGGKGNLVIVNVFPGVTVKIGGKVGDGQGGFWHDEWEKNLIIINCFGDGKWQATGNFDKVAKENWKEG